MWPHAPTLALVSDLTGAGHRREAAQALARHLGAEDLIIFVKDPEVDALLPAPGFPQTLPRGRAWRHFLGACSVADDYVADLPRLDTATPTRAVGVTAADGAVLVLLGGEPRPDAVAIVRALLPLLAAAFRGERLAVAAEGQAAMAREAAQRASALAEVLTLARRDLEQAVRTREEFLAAAAHDLKNPLASIKGIAQLLRRRVARGAMPTPERLAEGLGSIDVTATRMASLINELLDVTRLHLQQPLDLDPRPMDLVALARMVVTEGQASTEAHSIRVDAAVPELVGRYDASRLERVLGNLLSNAIKYSPAGGAIVVTVAQESADGVPWAILTVRDEGLGIPAADLERVFERFHRGSNVVGQIGGTGIGLATVWQVVEAHGGTVSVASEVGRGSRFTVRLPLSEQPSHADSERLAAAHGLPNDGEERE